MTNALAANYGYDANGTLRQSAPALDGPLRAHCEPDPFGYHVIRLDDTRQASFPAFDDVKGQIKQRLEQTLMQSYQEELRTKAKTDYKFVTLQ